MAEDSSDENMQQAVRVQERFEFYGLALTFTVLGLSVQTGPGMNPVASLLELTSWGCLLGSGLVGLARIEDIPQFYRLAALKGQYELRAQGIRKAQIQGARTITALDLGEARPSEELLLNATTSVEKIANALAPHSARLSKKYKWQKRLFVAGFLLLFAARAYTPLIRAIRQFFA